MSNPSETGAADVLVLGGGVVGVSIAYYLVKSGFSVIVIEKDQVGRGCSYGNAGLITPSHAMPIAGPGVIKQALKWMWRKDSPLLIRPRPDWRLFWWMMQFASHCGIESVNHTIPVLRDLSRASLELFEELIAAEGIAFDYERRGLLSVFSTEAAFEKGCHEAELMASHGFNGRILTDKEAVALEPALRVGVAGGIYYNEDAHGDSYQFVSRMTELIASRGATITTNTAARRIVPAQNGVVRVLAKGREFSGKYLVVATGSWTPALAKDLGVKIPVQPGKGYSVTMDRPTVSPKIPILHAAKKMAVTPIGNRLRFAGTMEFAGLDLRPNPTRTDAVLRSGLEIIAESGGPRNLQPWCGLRPCTPDTLPIVDRLARWPQVYIATGHAMLGYTLGPITGKLVAEMIGGKEPSLPTRPLRLDRF